MKTLFKYSMLIVGVIIFPSVAFCQTPTITSFSPMTGYYGTLITLTGTNLSSPTSVTIGGTSALIVKTSATSIEVIASNSAVSGPIVVNSPGGNATSSGSFTITNLPQNGNLTDSLMGSDHSGYAGQGYSVFVTANGNRAISGAPFDNGNNGAAFVFSETNGVWSENGSKITVSDNIGAAQFGSSVSASADGTTLAVGGPADNSGNGAVWIFTRGAGFTEQSKLLVSDNIGAAGFGGNIALSANGNTLIAAGQSDNNGIGAVWVFTRANGVWSTGTKITTLLSDNIGTPGWGSAVCISYDGLTAFIGGNLDNSGVGAAWAMSYNGTSWTEQAKLVGTGNTGASGQGSSLATGLKGNTLLSGAPNDNAGTGAVWVFTRASNPITWSQQTILYGTGINGATNVGTTVALSSSGNMGVIGAKVNNGNQGAGWIYSRTGSTWSSQGSGVVGSSDTVTTPVTHGYMMNMSSDGSTFIIGGSAFDTLQGAIWFYQATNGQNNFNTWIGTTSNDWNTSSNWSKNSTPSSSDTVIIKTIAQGASFPVLNTSTSIGGLHLDTTNSTLVINQNSTLFVSGNVNNLGTISGNGILNMNGTIFQELLGNGIIQNLTINNNSGHGVSLGMYQSTMSQIITGILTLQKDTLFVNGKLTLASTANNTACIAPIDQATNYGYLNGEITVQRYIPAHNNRVYTLVSSPVNNTNIYNGWQEGGTLKAGYGTIITGTSTFNTGFDAISASGNASIFRYNDFNASGSKWVGLNSTLSNYLGAGTGYLLFVRGDRTVTPGVSSGTQATTLEATGMISQGTVTFTTGLGGTNGTAQLANAASLYTLIANPYPCAIDWNSLGMHKNYLVNSFTVYDPNLGVFVSSDGTTLSNVASSQSPNIIQSGQAFFIQNDASNNSPSLLIYETAKNTTASTGIIQTVFGSDPTTSRINLNLYRQDHTLADGAVIKFGSNYTNMAGVTDIDKFPNFTENLSVLKQSRNLSICSKPKSLISDTISLALDQINAGNSYSLQFAMNAWDLSGYSNISLVDETKSAVITIDPSTTTSYSFTAESSTLNERFKLILSNKNTYAVNIDQNATNNALQVNLMGNPVKNIILAKYLSKTPGNTTISLIQDNGHIIASQSLGMQQQGNIELPVAGYAAGLYFLSVQVGENSATVKVVIE